MELSVTADLNYSGLRGQGYNGEQQDQFVQAGRTGNNSEEVRFAMHILILLCVDFVMHVLFIIA